MKWIIILVGLLVLSGCGTESPDMVLSDEIWGNTTTISSVSYTGDLFYCFYSEYKEQDVCLPYTNETFEMVIVAENITDYQIMNNSEAGIAERLNIAEEVRKGQCLENARRYCHETCGKESGLILSDDGMSYDATQFDKDNDGNWSSAERAEWDYILWVYQRCHGVCTENVIYPCYR